VIIVQKMHVFINFVNHSAEVTAVTSALIQ